MDELEQENSSLVHDTNHYDSFTTLDQESSFNFSDHESDEVILSQTLLYSMYCHIRTVPAIDYLGDKIMAAMNC